MITSLSELDLTIVQKKEILEWFAYKVWVITQKAGGEESFYHKSYDPLTIELDKKIAHSYVLSLSGSGRHHQFEDLEQLEEMITNATIAEVKDLIDLENYQ